MDLRPVLRTEDLPTSGGGEARLRRVRVGSTDLLVARLESGRVLAFAARCPHQATPLDEARFWDGNVRCPRHQYLYDPRTGENLLPAREARPETLWKLKPGYLPVHKAEERDGQIWVAEDPEPPPPSYDPEREAGPAVVPAASLPSSSGPSASLPSTPGRAGAQAGPVTHPTEAIYVEVGEEVELVLPTAATPGCFWKLDVGGGLVAVVGQAAEPGPPPRQRVRLSARAAGRTTVHCAYGRPWDAQPAEVRTFEVVVED